MTLIPAPSRTSPVLGCVVEVWRVSMDIAPRYLESCWRVLPAIEQSAANRFRRDADRHSFVARRAVRRWILGGHLGVEPDKLAFAAGPFGKPAITGPSSTKIQFSAASTDGLALIALVAEAPIGVDVEVHRPLGEDLERLTRTLAREEQSALDRLPPRTRLSAFYDCWTRKEAILKALGRGLSLGLDRFAVTVDPAQLPAILRFDEDTAAASRWALIPIEVGNGFSATLAGPVGARVVLRDWSWRDQPEPDP